MPQPESDTGLWVLSDVSPLGVYTVTITYEGDRAFVLDRTQALRYAATAAAAATRASHDAMVFKMFTEQLGLPVAAAVAFIALDVRPERAPLDDRTTRPLRFVPSMTVAGKPFVMIEMDGRPDSQVDPAALALHAGHVLAVLEAVDLDAALLRVLRGALGLEERVARAAVGELANWHFPGT